ncbi:MAG: 3,4-dihydroxy-2-butanone-4-phosphate synthase, partial [Candidatus Methanomethylophilaceae archaeon]|nr:3,4-dihydroxy-2-butanone-4-phosphate synthase [Candidatus Methanomethylophilaceae archaeon]
MGINFRAPGQVHLLNTSEKILENRKGHTELCTALMMMAGVKPSA